MTSEGAFDHHSEYNTTCPYCGVEGQLKGDCTLNSSGIPLGDDGYDINEGSPVGGELYNITCAACNKDVPVEHYFEHGDAGSEECYCNAEIVVNLGGPQA